MGKHNFHEEPTTTILPLTVEQLAAQDRPLRRRRRSAIIAVAAVALLAIGAATWALTGSTGPRQLLAPDTGPSPAAIVDGFGSRSPHASPATTRSTRSTPSRSTGPSPEVTAGPPAPTGGATIATSPMAARYQVTATWSGGYEVRFVVSNPAMAPALWTVRLTLAPGATLGNRWNADYQATSGAWVIRPPHWDDDDEPTPVPANGQHEFGFIVLQSGGQRQPVSCTIDGHPCQFSRA